MGWHADYFAMILYVCVFIDRGYGTDLMKEVAKVSNTSFLTLTNILHLCNRLPKTKTVVEWCGKSLTGTPEHSTYMRELVDSARENG